MMHSSCVGIGNYRPDKTTTTDRVVAGGDYGELLHRGQVSSPDGVDPEAWRADIRAQARRNNRSRPSSTAPTCSDSLTSDRESTEKRGSPGTCRIR